jgi:disulfide oxidoreductase YuzD
LISCFYLPASKQMFEFLMFMLRGSYWNWRTKVLYLWSIRLK